MRQSMRCRDFNISLSDILNDKNIIFFYSYFTIITYYYKKVRNEITYILEDIFNIKVFIY